MPEPESDSLFEFALDANIRASTVGGQGPSSEDIAAINRLALRPITAEDVAIFRMELCNNKVDRHNSMFPEKELRKINRLIVGKPLMELHDLHGRQALGRFFRSTLQSEADTVTVVPDCYMLRIPSNEAAIKNIEGGVWAGTSISFSFKRAECSICSADLRDCSHWPGKDYEVNGKKTVCNYIMHDVYDVYEGSVVPLGSQSTEFIAARGATDTGKELSDIDTALKQARDARGTKYESPIMPTQKRIVEESRVYGKLSGKRALTEIAKDQSRALEISRSLQPELR